MSLKEVIEKRTKELEEKLKIKDFKAASTYYTENCVLMPSTGETFVGRNGKANVNESVDLMLQAKVHIHL